MSLLAVLLCLVCSAVSAAPAEAPGETAAIPALIGQLGRDNAADAATLARLRPLIMRDRGAGAAPATVGGVPEDAWLGTLETIRIDKQDAQGKIATALVQRILHSNGDALRVYALHGELDAVGDGMAVIVTGYRVGNRVLVTEVSQAPVDRLP